MFGKEFKRKYALTDQGLKNTKQGTFWTVLVNLITMGGVSILYLVMSGFMETLTEGKPLPGAVPVTGGVLLFVLCDPLPAVQGHLRPGVRRGQGYAPRAGGAASQTSSRLLRKAGSGRPDGNHYGGCEPHGARLVARTGVSVRRIHFHGCDRRLPAFL